MNNKRILSMLLAAVICLFCVPLDKQISSSVLIPDSVTIIGDFAFNNCKSLKSITILNSDCDIPSMEYTISNGFDAETGTVYYNGTIRGYDNSTAQTYALKHNYDFKSLGKAPTDGSTTATDQIIGDVNGDGNFNISDVVIFQKWILAVPNTKLVNWKMADFCEDDRLDVFDLCLMKRTLFEGQ